jgi:hypothetical protein
VGASPFDRFQTIKASRHQVFGTITMKTPSSEPLSYLLPAGKLLKNGLFVTEKQPTSIAIRVERNQFAGGSCTR